MTTCTRGCSGRLTPGVRPRRWSCARPEVDSLAASRLGERVARAFTEDLSAGVFHVEGLGPRDLTAAWALMKRYPRLPLGLVDAVVMVQAERLKARAIVTLDLRHFRAVKLQGNPKLLPLDG